MAVNLLETHAGVWMKSSEELIADVRRGDENAFQLIFEQHHRFVFRFLYGLHVSAAGRAGKRRFGKSPVVPTVDQVARRAEQQYLSTVEILSRDIKRRRATISPALLSALKTTLAEVDRNIGATRRAAREQPGDPVAVQYLALAYEKKLELLREVTSR